MRFLPQWFNKKARFAETLFEAKDGKQNSIRKPGTTKLTMAALNDSSPSRKVRSTIQYEGHRIERKPSLELFADLNKAKKFFR